MTESLGFVQFLLILGGSVAGAAIIAALAWAVPTLRLRSRKNNLRRLDPSFLFDDDVLVDTTHDAQRMIECAPPQLPEKDAVIAMFQQRFPTLAYVMAHLPSKGVENLPAADGAPMALKVEDVDGMTRVTLCGATEHDGLSFGEVIAHESTRQELAFMRKLVDASPHLMWTQDSNGRVVWANAAYMRVSDEMTGDSAAASQRWPQAMAFPDLHLDAQQGKSIVRRAAVTPENSTDHAWFEVTSLKYDDTIMHFASDAAATVRAEHSKIKAMQTSGRLFGDLSTGLAIFDQKRQLTIFNPSLTDLTRLKPEFLAGRPTLEMFLDTLRESRILPEPKNYASWREQFTALETAARAGTYCENWETIDGQTFRVTGKPYADKSFVFLFDDITAEVALTRRFRVDIETGQAVLDTLPDAIAVFSANGTLLMSNSAYKTLWQSDHDGSMHSHQLRGEIIQWQRHCAATPSWSDLRAYIASTDKADTWLDHLILDDGRHMQCEARGINARSTMIRFFAPDTQSVSPVLSKITQSDPALQPRRG